MWCALWIARACVRVLARAWGKQLEGVQEGVGRRCASEGGAWGKLARRLRVGTLKRVWLIQREGCA